jgi:hypothetical protein
MLVERGELSCVLYERGAEVRAVLRCFARVQARCRPS